MDVPPGGPAQAPVVHRRRMSRQAADILNEVRLGILHTSASVAAGAKLAPRLSPVDNVLLAGRINNRLLSAASNSASALGPAVPLNLQSERIPAQTPVVPWRRMSRQAADLNVVRLSTLHTSASVAAGATLAPRLSLVDNDQVATHFNSRLTSAASNPASALGPAVPLNRISAQSVLAPPFVAYVESPSTSRPREHTDTAVAGKSRRLWLDLNQPPTGREDHC
jgi:hypothetical protein